MPTTRKPPLEGKFAYQRIRKHFHPAAVEKLVTTSRFYPDRLKVELGKPLAALTAARDGADPQPDVVQVIPDRDPRRAVLSSLHAVTGVVQSYDGILTMRVLRAGGVEANPLMKPVTRSEGTMLGVKIAAAVATVEPYGCPALQAPAGKTTYHLVVSPEGLVRPDRSATREEAASADRNTIFVIESPEGRAMPWMDGGDDGVEVLMGSDEGCHAGGVMALFADGSVHFLHIDSLPLDVRRSLITPEADTPPGSFDLP